jgi:hypothetical protein
MGSNVRSPGGQDLRRDRRRRPVHPVRVEADHHTYACRPYLWGNNETCTHSNTQAGYYVMIRGYSTYSGVTLSGTY